jgi:triacylglycerol esterase/lipase EstA (alpha/beta hydrolase family)
MPATWPSNRLHVVLVPGFGGFDALGQLEYYAGVTQAFLEWQLGRGDAGPWAVLHYFDSLPTASVVTRARRLGAYLARRVARGEFAPGDALALVGHSTGGLDIRQLVRELATAGAAAITTDAASFPVAPGVLLDMLQRLVFLSVPQRGTNLADWWHARLGSAGAPLMQLVRRGLAGSQATELDVLEAWVAGRLAGPTRAQALAAVQDALLEMHDCTCLDETDRAAAQEAAALLRGLARRAVWGTIASCARACCSPSSCRPS